MTNTLRRLRWLVIALAVFVLVAAAAAAVPFLVPVDRYRGFLEGYIRSLTGRDVQIATLRLQVWPRPHVRAGDVRMMNPAGFPKGATVEVQTIDLGVDLRALLRRRFDIQWVALNGVRINFLTNTAGRSNFDLPAQKRRPSIGGNLVTLAPIGAVAIRSVDLRVGAYDPKRAQTTPSFEITGLTARSRSVQATAPEILQLLTATVDLKGARLTVPALRVPVQVGSGTMTLAKGGLKATFAATLDTLRVTGTADVPRIYAPVISFALAGTDLDLNRLQGLLNPQPAQGPPGPPGPHRLVAAGTVGLDKFEFAPVAASRVRARIGLFTDAVRVDAYSLTAYGGTITGAAEAKTAAAGAPASFTVHARGVDVAGLLHGVGATAQVTGSLGADGALQTRLTGDPRASLAGAGTFAIRNGSFPGLDVRSGLARLAQALQANVPTGQTRFSYFGGDARIARERVYSTALRLDGDTLQATGHGSIGFDGGLDYAGTGVMALSASGASPSPIPSAATLLGRYVPGAAGARATSVPFKLTGAVANPHFALGGVPSFVGGTATSPAPRQTTPAQPQAPGLPSFLQNLPKLP
ncbi:MAG TPA: AsmA family protein [bacterium]|nr:AsmA family protein [bacterium]